MTRALLPYLLFALTAVTGKCTYDHGQRRQGVLLERLRVADSTLAAWSTRAARVDTIYRRDTVRLTRALTRWDTVRAGVDTLRDTVRVPVEVVRLVVAEADSTIEACRAVVLTCEARVAVRDTMITALRRQVDLVRAQRPGVVQRWGERALWLAAGALLMRASTHTR